MIKAVSFLTLFIWIPSFVTAQVIVNEIAWMGTPVEGVEAKQWWRYEWFILNEVERVVPQTIKNSIVYS